MNDGFKNIPKGGPFDSRTHIYVERPIDGQFLKFSETPGEWISIYGCRAMGKTSLLFRHQQALESLGYTVIYVDVGASFGSKQDVSFRQPSQWVKKLGEAIAFRCEQYSQEIFRAVDKIDVNWPAPISLEHLIINGILSTISGPILLVLDEFDTFKDLDIVDDVLFSLRQLLACKIQNPALRRLSVCFISLVPCNQLGRAGTGNTSPFGEAIWIEDFETSKETYASFRQAFPSDQIPKDDVLTSVMSWSGGQPLITMELLTKVFQRRIRTSGEVDELAKAIAAGPHTNECKVRLFREIHRTILQLKLDGLRALFSYERLLQESREAQSSEGAELLEVAGLLKRVQGVLIPKGTLFRQCFDLEWVNSAIKSLTSLEPRYRGSGSDSSKRILLINTGGTLGMIERDGVVVPPRGEEEYKAYFERLEAIGRVKYLSLSPRDSINVFPDQWIAIARCIYEHRHHGFSGVVVIHGTDTMADTASAVAFALGPNLSFPVVFTGAQTTPDIAHGDAHPNLYRACETAKQDIPEVVICFGNYVYRAVRSQKIDDRRFNGFESPTYFPLAEITGEIKIRRELIRPLPAPLGDIELRANFAPRILIIPQVPGLEPELYQRYIEENSVNGIILETRGAGNVVSEDPYAFIPFVRDAFLKGIPVVITSQYPPDPGSHERYRPAQAPLAAGAVHAGNMTLAAATTKFRWVLGGVVDKPEWINMDPHERRKKVIRWMVEEPIIGEFDQNERKREDFHE